MWALSWKPPHFGFVHHEQYVGLRAWQCRAVVFDASLAHAAVLHGEAVLGFVEHNGGAVFAQGGNLRPPRRWLPCVEAELFGHLPARGRRGSCAYLRPDQ